LAYFFQIEQRELQLGAIDPLANPLSAYERHLDRHVVIRAIFKRPLASANTIRYTKHRFYLFGKVRVSFFWLSVHMDVVMGLVELLPGELYHLGVQTRLDVKVGYLAKLIWG